jgi:hypothetical protein
MINLSIKLNILYTYKLNISLSKKNANKKNAKLIDIVMLPRIEYGAK